VLTFRAWKIVAGAAALGLALVWGFGLFGGGDDMPAPALPSPIPVPHPAPTLHVGDPVDPETLRRCPPPASLQPGGQYFCVVELTGRPGR
jgi:hypothetical protein